MPSPFPGMDPYIEPSGRWGGFHHSMLAAMRGQLNARLPRRFAAETDLYVWVQEPTGGRRRGAGPDVYIREKAGRPKPSAGAVAVAAPATIVLPSGERKKKSYLRVIDNEMNRVVTVIELLSPSNKEAGKDRDAYWAKRGEYLANRVSLVEIDLLRGGTRPPLGDPPAAADYYGLVCRYWEYPRAGLWSFGLRDPLPDLPIPLAPDVSDVLLSLRPCVDRAYEEGRYQTELPYHKPVSPRLSKKDVAWVREVLAERPPELSA